MRSMVAEEFCIQCDGSRGCWCVFPGGDREARPHDRVFAGVEKNVAYIVSHVSMLGHSVCNSLH
jgi:hypothetical protein